MKSIDVNDLLLDTENPRFESQISQRDAMEKMVSEQGVKLVNLAEHIADHGFNPSDPPIVIKSTKNANKHIVLEGNRRLVAVKLALEPKLVDSFRLPSSLANRFKALNNKKEAKLPLSIDCSIAKSRKEANIWIELKHTGENAGRGTIRWSGLQADRFRGASTEKMVIQKVIDSEYLDEKTRDKLSKLSITNIKRLVSTPEARKILGIDSKNNQLIVTGQDDRVTGRLAIIVSDIANKYVKVTQLDTKEQRIEYANKVVERPLPKKYSKIAPTFELTKRKKRSSSNKNRTTLIPGNLKIEISEKRIAEILKELQKLPLVKFVNSSAVLLRVFVEMSVSYYGKQHRISFKDDKRTKKGPKETIVIKELSLRKKILKVIGYMKDKSIADSNELKGIKVIANNKDHVLSVDSWNAYVHNKDYHPSDSDLINNWDNMSPFIQKIWLKK